MSASLLQVIALSLDEVSIDDPPITLRPLRVLVAEDDGDARNALASAVQTFGHRCSVAHNGSVSLEMHRGIPFDVILSDWRMPVMDGIELCRQVRRIDGESRYTYFVLTTALGDKDQIMSGLRAGADDYLVKPVELDLLEARLIPARRIAHLVKREQANAVESLRRNERLRNSAASIDGPVSRR